MKKMSKFAVAALLVLGIASGAQAAEIKATGKWQIDATSASNTDFNSGNKDQTFRIEQRVRTAFEFIANENLKGVLDTQIGSNSWGNGEYQISAGRTPANNLTATGSNSVGAGNIMLRKAYIDFKWPGTKVNVLAGFQTVNLPSAFGGGSAILDDQVAALVVSAPITDGIKLTAGYARPFDANTAGSTAFVQGEGTASNVFFAALPVDLAGSTNITPFGAWADAGYQSVMNGSTAVSSAPAYNGFASRNSRASNGLKGWWGGVAFTTKLLDPFKIMADFNYGSVDYTDGVGGRSGWLADIAVDYTGLSMMTPELFFVYSSGDGDSGKAKGGRMPTLGNPQSWTVGSLFFGDADLISRAATTNQTASYSGSSRNVMGFWTLGVALKDIKFIDKLSHRVNLLYVRGTNDKDALSGLNYLSSTYAQQYGAYLTTQDSLWEVDLNNKYQMYQELSLMLNLGYMTGSINHYNGVTNDRIGNVLLRNSAYRATASLVYSF